MATLKVIEEGRIRYSMTTWQGEVELNDEVINYRYSEDDNGAELFILTENGWESANTEENENYALLWATIMAWGSPEELGGAGELIDLDETELEDYL